jgi:hypothetical protein
VNVAIIVWTLVALLGTALAVLAYVRRVLCPWSALVGVLVAGSWAAVVLVA